MSDSSARDPEFDAHLDAVIVGPRTPTPVVLVEYDDAWPGQFEQHRARISAALLNRARLIEHIGSTSVPGLVAKPIIDVLVAVDDVEDETMYLSALEAAGYELRVRETGHRMVRPATHDANVHIYSVGHPEIDACITFRDRLRADPTDRAIYEARKRDLARHDWPDINYYARAKGEVIATVLSRAQT
ncbi:MAG: hypothetical protein QOG53_1162 [Frankiales bacterium]|jgi:GrpB-like predicted nucleotidyltransferase (UPF0157 family)|nr:hypothetical protein [Frankiales bacterium]